MKGKPLSSQCQSMVMALLQYFEREKDNKGPLISLNAVQERVAQALNIGIRTVNRLKKRAAENPVLRSPGKSRPRQKKKTADLDDNIKTEIRQVIYNMYADKKHITLKSLNSELTEKKIVELSTSSLQRLLPELGFKWKKDDNRRYLIEKTSVALLRNQFLRKYKANQESSSPLPVIFLDETWIFAKGNPRKSWQDGNVKSVKRPTGYEGKRFIVAHAGGENGFVQNASLVMASKTKLQDYHGEMNSNTFTDWLKNKLLVNLEEPSLIIMDNAPYHSVLAEKQPTAAFTKNEIIAWLNKNNILFADGLTKIELLNIARQHKQDKRYIVDEIIREWGHEVLRTPPYQCEFNAIELIWSQCKRYYDSHIGRDGNTDENVLDMWTEALEKISPDTWKECVRHTDDEIKKWYERVILHEVEPVIINLTADSETDLQLSSEDDTD